MHYYLYTLLPNFYYNEKCNIIYMHYYLYTLQPNYNESVLPIYFVLVYLHEKSTMMKSVLSFVYTIIYMNYNLTIINVYSLFILYKCTIISVNESIL